MITYNKGHSLCEKRVSAAKPVPYSQLNGRIRSAARLSCWVIKASPRVPQPDLDMSRVFR